VLKYIQKIKSHKVNYTKEKRRAISFKSLKILTIFLMDI